MDNPERSLDPESPVYHFGERQDEREYDPYDDESFGVIGGDHVEL